MLSDIQQLTPQKFQAVASANHAVLGEKLLELNTQLNADYLFLAAIDESANQAHAVVTVAEQDIGDNFSYELKYSPCEHVYQTGVCVYDKGVTDAFPNDIVLQEMQIEGYIGSSIHNLNGEPIGILVALFTKPISLSDQQYAMFNMAASNMGTFFEAQYFNALQAEKNNLLKQVCKKSGVGLWEYDVKSDRFYWSTELFNMLAMESSESPLTLENSLYFIIPEQRDAFNQLFSNSIKTGEGFTQIFECQDRHLNKRWLNIQASTERDVEQQVCRVFGSCQDVTSDRVKLQTKTREASYVQRVLDTLNDAVIITDTRGKITDVNAIACKMFGYSKATFCSLTVNTLMPDHHAHRHDSYMENYLKTGEAKIIGVGRQLTGMRADNSTFQMELSLSDTEFNGERFFIGVIRDISERIKAQDRIYQLAFIDPLTGLKNREWFRKELTEHITRAKRQDHKLYCALVDVDKLSQQNLLFGTERGNLLIGQIGESLTRILGNDFSVYKKGADSFLLLSKKTSRELPELMRLVETTERKVLDVSAYRFHLDDVEINTSVSIGSATFDAHSINFDDLIATLEIALTNAKRNAPFGHSLVTSDDVRQHKRKVRIKHALRDITEHDELYLELQPQYDQQKVIAGSEALIRWHSPVFGLVRPDEFIPLAEDDDTIIDIGYWVIERVCQILEGVKAKGFSPNISINISGRHIIQADFAASVSTILNRYDIQPSQLTLELTETAIVKDIELVKSSMRQLSEKGIRFSIDDFGTGYSSLSYLQELPIDELKIDRYFVSEIESSSQIKIIDMVINMAKTLEVITVAEGIETQGQLDYLIKRGATLFQGYLFSKPIGVDDWIQTITSED